MLVQFKRKAPNNADHTRPPNELGRVITDERTGLCNPVVPVRMTGGNRMLTYYFGCSSRSPGVTLRRRRVLIVATLPPTPLTDSLHHITSRCIG